MEQKDSSSQFACNALAVLRFPQTAAGECLRGRKARLYTDGAASALERLLDCVYVASLWFSLPLAIWFSSSRIGLLLHWQACQMRPAWWRRILKGRR